MKKLLYSFAVVLLASSGIMAQEFKCHTDHYFQQMVDKDPSIAKDLKNLIANSQVAKSGDDSTVYVIPVVFHILHENGVENIPDANIFDVMEVLNRDFSKQNEDTVEVNEVFKPIIADVKIQFKLASYDPLGNCTNGINRIFTHETNVGDNLSKLSQWDRSRYLNVWVVRSMEGGTAGFAIYPSGTNGTSYWLDGIVVRYNYIGRLSPSSENNSRTLTHEVGHWLSVPHVWGSTNEPMVACGDEGISDTPITKGYNYCPANGAASMICDNTIEENYQNYMDYSFCTHMFTEGQAALMRTAVVGEDGRRNNLITPETHALTGIDLTTPPVCIPKAAIKANRKYICQGQTVSFEDVSYNGPVTYREWTFEGGSPATSTDANPTVTYNEPGVKTVTLKVGNATGEDVKTFVQYIDVAYTPFVGPKVFDFNTPEAYGQLRYNNIGENFGKFGPTTNGLNSNGAKLGLYKDLTGTIPGTEPSRYYSNLGNQVDEIITPLFDLRHTSGVTFSFDYSYATNAAVSTEITEEIRVWYARGCSENWVPLGTSTTQAIKGADLISGGLAGGNDYAPASASDWKNWSRPFNVTSTDDKTRFKIQFTASDLSNNLYIDNIMIGGTLGLADDFSSEHQLIVSPNPVVGGGNLNIQYVAANEPVTFTLRNLQGEAISTVVRNEMNQAVSFGFEISENVAASYYFLEVTSAGASTVKKIAVIK